MAGEALSCSGLAWPVSWGTLDTGLTILRVSVANKLVARFAVSEVVGWACTRRTLDTAGEVSRYTIDLQGPAAVGQETVAWIEPGEDTTYIYW